MIDWLRRDPATPSTVRCGDRDVPVSIVRHPTARRIILRPADDGQSVRVTLPRWGRTADALRFAAERSDWLAAQLARIPERRPPGPGGSIAYRGETCAIAWDANGSREVAHESAACVIRIGGPRDLLEARLRRWLRAEASRLLTQDLADYSRRAGLPPAPLALSNARRRWGSCSSKGTIRLNWRLVQAPDFVRRSVAAHETAHRVHFDHSPRFHALLGEIFESDIGEADAWLRAHGRSLYAAFG
ncbi:M48 family metallopeptidase [Erythrobacter sp. LQ02-29]|uniref:M48 family metallopeptidase n=1 Tax=Erythrobacter sp. LQ02-29 TaxID=2920384 RepID=UPI001F4E960D|nr:SprT family zinc-dependent metalloprotease [Erythrobacter sp. LQ02-29]MCP9221189.1 M48 family metallopeptidase [Erythrobacter sp. LQ02-29]